MPLRGKQSSNATLIIINVLELRKNNVCCNQEYNRAKYVNPGMATRAITAVMITSEMSSAIAKRIYSFNEAMS